MTDAERIWRSKTDEQVEEAASNLADYTEEGKRIIRAEFDRRGLSQPVSTSRHEEVVTDSYDSMGPESESKILMRLNGSRFLTNTWKQELVITDEGVRGEVLAGFKRLKTSLSFDRIAQVNLVRGVFAADLELVNKGGADNLCIKALNKEEAEKAKELIESKMRTNTTKQAVAAGPILSTADEIAKLAALKDSGVLTEDEFQAAKKRLLDM